MASESLHNENAIRLLKGIADSEPAAMDLWWESVDDGWSVPDHVPAAFLRYVLKEVGLYD